MAANAVVFDLPAEAVFSVLSDPSSYPSFIVGTRRVRRFDPRWPETGSVLDHSQGVGPLVVRGRTTVVDDGRRLVLRAQLGRLGVHRVCFTVTPMDTGTRVEVDEHPIGGPSAMLWNPVSEAMMSLRNRRLLRRLGVVAKRRFERDDSDTMSTDSL